MGEEYMRFLHITFATSCESIIISKLKIKKKKKKSKCLPQLETAICSTERLAPLTRGHRKVFGM